jgi:hypothetical protein
MTNSSRPLLSLIVVGVAAAWMTLPACSTQQVGADAILVDPRPTGAAQGLLVIVCAPTPATYEEQQADRSNVAYDVFIDGKLAMWDNGDGTVSPVALTETGAAYVGFIAAGRHRLVITTSGGGPTVFSGDAEIVDRSMTRLYVFGPRDAREGRLVSYPLDLPRDTVHVSVINLLRAGPDIEVVRCADATDCTVVSPVLALGESFEGEFPVVPGWQPAPAVGGAEAGRSLSPAGAGMAYRPVATRTISPEPLQTLFEDYWSSSTMHFSASPRYIASDGTILSPGD